jgi:cathepsin A (carboxypeptidase C)
LESGAKMRRLLPNPIAAIVILCALSAVWAAPAAAPLESVVPEQSEVESFEAASSAHEKQAKTAEVEAVEDKQDVWRKERQAIWDQDQSTLSKTDKAMHQALESQLDEIDSPQWARYLRHKNVHPPAKEGHSWAMNGIEHHGQMEELMSETPKNKRLCDKSVKQHHGYFKISKNKKARDPKNYFYWFFESRKAPKTAPLVLWLTGGPGCSSEIALFTENGPCQVDRMNPKRTKTNKYSWNNNAHILFVDQPAGAGFSYGDESDNSETKVSNDLYHFLQEFMKKYPKYHKAPFYIFGESYAGHFVPALSYRVFKGNQNHDGEYIALRGQGIGNGLTDPVTQYKYYPMMAYQSKTTPKAVSGRKFDGMHRAIPGCVSRIKSCNRDRSMCPDAFSFCAVNMISPIQEAGVNVYDLRKQCSNPPLCYDMSPMATYLRSKRVTSKLGVKKTWHSCNFGVNGHFHTDWMISQKHKIPPVLANGVRTIVYAGDVDFICNWMGNKAWTKNMRWSGQKGFNVAKDKAWKMVKTKGGKSEVVGRERTHAGFTFLQIHKAGHMVPMDQPKVALHMLNSFTQGKVMVPVGAADEE